MAKLGQYGEALEQMTEQEVFDVTVRHLLEQGEQSLLSVADTPPAAFGQALCAYSGTDGLCCAAAPFIRKYSTDLERTIWQEVIDTGAASSANMDLITRLQRVHDTKQVEKWYSCLSSVAEVFKLNTKILEEYSSVSK